MISIVLFLSLSGYVVSENCYWNEECPYQLYSSKTPYDTIRGDIRDYKTPNNCEAISVWSLNRHGNRNPGNSITEETKKISELKSDIIASFEAGTSQLCAQDIDEFRKWTWNETLEMSQSFLTGIGYEEIFDLAKRTKLKYSHLLNGTSDKYYFRTTNEQRTITSSMAYVQGLTEDTNLDLGFDGPWDRDDVIRPYENCERYQTEVKGGKLVEDELEDYEKTEEYIAVQNRVQKRLGISHQLTASEIYTLYEICRFYRSWTDLKQSPWCSVFSHEDLIVLEYRDDVRHYYRNGYGSWINVNLGKPVLKDLYESFEAAISGHGKHFIAYFTHDTMMQMTFSALGLFEDDQPLKGSLRRPNRLWRSSHIAAFATNLMAVLNKCQDSEIIAYRVQLLVNEKTTTLCPEEGCTWSEFQNIFQKYDDSNLEFCDNSYREPEPVVDSSRNSAPDLLAVFLISNYTILKSFVN